MGPQRDITGLLVRWKEGDASALDALIPLVYAELRKLARSYLRHERRNHTLQATALVHEAFLKLAGEQPTDWQDRAHFFGIAARTMRQILVTHARRHNAQKRGGGETAESVDGHAMPQAPGVDLEALDAALSDLARRDPDQARIVELRFFGGYTIKETATIVRRSPATVSREWEIARMFLYRELARGSA